MNLSFPYLRIVLLVIGISFCSKSAGYAQQSTTDSLVLSFQKQNILFYALLDDKVNSQGVEEIVKNAEAYIPPILFALAQRYKVHSDYKKALYWSYVAQMRTRIDQEENDLLSQHKQKVGSLYQDYFKMEIPSQLREEPNSVKEIVDAAILEVKNNPVDYSSCWIYYDGAESIKKIKELEFYLPKKETSRQEIIERVVKEMQLKMENLER